MKILDGRKKIWLAGLAEVVLLLVYMIYCITGFSKIQMQFSQEEMQLQAKETQNSFGSYMDLSFSDARGIVTPEFELPEGIYYVTVKYDVHGPAMGGFVYEIPREDNELVNKNEFRVKENENLLSFRIKINDGEGIRFRLRLTGDAVGGDYLNLYEVKIAGSFLSCIYEIFIFFSCILFIDVIWIWYRRYKKSCTMNRIIMIAFPIAIFGLGLPLYQSGIVEGIDLPFHMSRIEGIYEGLKAGQFPVRIQPGWVEDYGYAVSVFYGDILLYLPALLRLVGFTLQDAYKIFLLAVHALTLFSAYYSFRTCFEDKVVSLTGAVLFAGSSERLFRIYSASQLGAFSAMIFYPIAFAGLFLLLGGSRPEKQKCAWLWLTGGFTGLLLTHMLSSLIVGSFGILACAIRFRTFFRKDTLLQVSKALGLWLLLNLWFLVPFLQYMGGDFKVTAAPAIGASQINYHAQMANYEKSSGTLAGIILETGESLGYVLVLVLVLFLITIPLRKKGREERQSYLILGLAMIGGILCLNWIPAVRIAEFSSLFLKLFQTIQYGIRFLTVVTFLTCILACYFLITLPLDKRKMCLTAAALCVLALFQTLNTLEKAVPDAVILETVDLGDNILGNEEYIPVGTDLNDMTKELRYDSAALTVESVQRKYLSFTACVKNKSDEDQTLSFPVLFYEGYQTKDSETGRMLKTEAGENNRVSVSIPAGYSGMIQMQFHEFWYWRGAEIVSILTLVIGIYVFVWYNRKEKRGLQKS